MLVVPGDYAVSEDSKTGWRLTDLTCSDSTQPAADSSNVDLGTRTATFDVQPGEVITCVFTNTKNGSITIEKQTIGGDGEFDFTSADVASFDAAQLADNETSGPVSVEPGDYSVSEDSKTGWDLTALACSDSAQADADDSNTNLGTRTATFDVQPGEEITCVFTNTKRGSITIEKQTVGGDASSTSPQPTWRPSTRRSSPMTRRAVPCWSSPATTRSVRGLEDGLGPDRPGVLGFGPGGCG